MGLAETAQLAVRIGLDDKLSPGLAKINGNLGHFEKGLGRTSKGVGQLAGGVAKAGLVVGAAVATAFTFATKTAIEFDDAFAAVRKTVSASGPELDALNAQLHDLATRIPIGYTDLAGIAAEAGALGVPTKSVAKFTETVARLSASTQGLTVDAAAEAFGKFRNILKLTDADLTRAASSLIALGNAGASSEGDIIEVAKRFGAAGHQAGLSAAQVLGFSSAIASLGVEPEAAGSSLSRLFNNITKYIGTGDKKIVAFAKTAGVSVKTFAKLFAKDATGAVETFLTGLSKLDRFQAANVLKHAGITNVRDINAVLLLSQNVGELKRQVDLSTGAFKANTELTDVSTKRFDTLKNKIIVLKNGFLEAGYNVSEGFLPALGRATDKLTAFLRLPENKKALQKLGTDLGATLDKIDFGKLLTAAQGAVKVLSPMVAALIALAGALNALPSEVKGGAAALIVANKVSGGAIGGGIAQIVGGLGESLARGLATHIPVFGKAFVQPVFVTNQGFGVPGGGGKESPADWVTGGGKAGVIGVLAGAAGAAVLTGIAALQGQISGSIADAMSAGNKDLAATLKGLFHISDSTANPTGNLLLDLPKNLEGLQHLDQVPVELGRIVDFLTGHHPAESPGLTGGAPGRGGTIPHGALTGGAPGGGGAAQLHVLRQQLAEAKKEHNHKLEAKLTREINALNHTAAAAKAKAAADAARQKAATDAVKAKEQQALVAFRAGERATQTGNSLTRTGNARLSAIAHKRTSFKVVQTFNAYTRVSVSELQRQARYTSRVARSTSLSAS